MGYRDGVLDKAIAWIEANPMVRRALPWASGVFVVVGFLIVLSSFGGGTAPQVPVTAPTAPDDLEKASAAALEYQRERVPPTFEGFTISTAEGMEPALTWVKKDPKPGEVAIRVAKSKNLLLIASDDTGIYCLALDASGQVSTGSLDAQKTAECTGGW